MITRDMMRRWWTIPDELVAACPEISRHNQPPVDPQEYPCGCVAIVRITDRDTRHDEQPFEMRLAMPCGSRTCDVARGLHLRELMKSRRWCYWVFPNSWKIEHANRFTLSIVVEGEAGHYMTDSCLIDSERITWSDEFAAATDEAYKLNRAALGLTERETARIVASMLGADEGRGDLLL